MSAKHRGSTFSPKGFFVFNTSHIRVAIATLALSATLALAHNHVTVDTASGSPGDKIILRAGYYPSESRYSVRSRRLLVGTGMACYRLPDQIQDGGAFDNWWVGDEVLLTSDFYFATGRLSGGDFRWEIASVRDVYTGASTELVWGEFTASGTFQPLASSQATTRATRSFDTHIAEHNHDQGYVFRAPGTYEVTFVVWDANGKYADSDPIRIRFQTGPFPKALPDPVLVSR